MPGARRTAILATATIAALGALAGCGGDGGGGAIPQETADEMLAAAAEIEEANANDDCETAQQRTTDLRNQVNDLGDGQVKRSLAAMVTRLDENVDAELCADTGTTDEPDPKPDEDTTTTTTPVEPTTPFEEPTTTTTPPPEEEEEPSTPEQPPGGGGGPPVTPPGQSGGGGGGGTAPPTGGVDEG